MITMLLYHCMKLRGHKDIFPWTHFEKKEAEKITFPGLIYVRSSYSGADAEAL